jgi:hypothetical protein
MATEFLGGVEKYRARVEKVRQIDERHLTPLS